MITNWEELVQELAAGTCLEHRHGNVELKQSWSQDVGKDVSALCNKSSLRVAWIVIGAADDGTLVRRDERWARQTEQQIGGHLNQYLDPYQACQHLEVRQVSGSWLVILQIANPGAAVTWNNKCYKVSGTSSVEMDPDESLGLTLSLPGLNDYSAQETTIRAYDEQCVSRIAARIAQRTKSGLFTDLPAVGHESALHRLGIRGRQVSRLLFADAAFRVVFYDAGGHPTRNESIRPLYRIFDPKLRDDINDFSHHNLFSNEDVYPIAAFQEAIANAVAHAAYYQDDGDIMLEVYPTRLCVSNLCTRESAHFANRWFSQARFCVNRLLMDTLRAAGHVDELGRGKGLIFGDYISSGREPPSVVIERTGRFARWRLVLPGSPQNPRHVRMLEKLREHYEGDEQRARIALALVLWRNQPVEQLRRHVDGEFAPLFAEVLADVSGATFFWQEKDQIILNRWARLLLHEGVNSKSLTEQEEAHLYALAQQLSAADGGLVTPQNIRDWGELGRGQAAETMSSRILSQWTSQGRAERVKKGLYRILSSGPKPSPYREILMRLTKK